MRELIAALNAKTVDLAAFRQEAGENAYGSKFLICRVRTPEKERLGQQLIAENPNIG